MRHVKQDGTNNNVIITLHGTGGSATDLFQIAQYIDKDATLIGFQGEVIEQGMARYFERNNDGSFNLRSLAEATYDLRDSINDVIEKHNLQEAHITLMGYSNGANLAQSYFKEFENTPINLALLYHPSVTKADESFKAQKDLRVLVTSGANDPYISSEQFETLTKQLEAANIEVISFHHQYGHQLIQDELVKSKEIYG